MALFKRRSRPTNLESEAHLDELLADGRPVLIDFWQRGCMPCQTMDGIVNELFDEYGDRIHVAKANPGAAPELFQRFNVRSTPTFILLTPTGRVHKKTGRPAATQRWRASGLVKKDVLVRTLENNGAASGS